MSREIAVVRWGSLNSRASLYGTELTLAASGEVHLENSLMPAGTTLQEWYSFSDYQSVRDIPALPLLHHGRRYSLDALLEASPPDSVIFDVRYFDRFNGLIRTDVLYPPSYSFEYPADCYYYTIRLLNAGCDEVRFTSFALREDSAAQDASSGVDERG